MNANFVEVYRCPMTGGPLRLESETRNGDDIVKGALVSADGTRYPIAESVAHFINLEGAAFTADELRELQYYESTSDSYDSVMDWMFESFYEDEAKVREAMVDLLELKPGARVLETGSGTCRDSIRIAERIGREGTLVMLDLSPKMLHAGRRQMLEHPAEKMPAMEFMVGNAVNLPFPDGYFDASFHFGGLNLFHDKAQALAEMARVTKKGGKVLAGDESLAPWLRETDYGKVLLNSNHLYRYPVPLEDVPVGAREVCLRWLIGNAFYTIDFRVDSGPPAVDLDKPILGRRGGTHRTRFYGGVEGISPEAKSMLEKAAAQSGKSLHEWLDAAVRRQAKMEQGGS